MSDRNSHPTGDGRRFSYEQGEPSGVPGSPFHRHVLVEGVRVPGYLHIDAQYHWWAVNAAGVFHGPFVPCNSAARELIAQAAEVAP